MSLEHPLRNQRLQITNASNEYKNTTATKEEHD